jgi:hypothetical protein
LSSSHLVQLFEFWGLVLWQFFGYSIAQGFILRLIGGGLTVGILQVEIQLLITKCCMHACPFRCRLLGQEWYLETGDFLCGTSPAQSISLMNQMQNVVTKAMKGFHPKPDVKLVLLEALKFCATCLEMKALVKQLTQRLTICFWLF